MRKFHLLTAAVAITSFAGIATAHGKLVSASPVAGTTVASPNRITLRFNEPLMPAFSKGDLVMSAMPGMAEMKMSSNATVGADGKTLVITPKARLSKGKYVINWRVAFKDTHKVTGRYAFAVK